MSETPKASKDGGQFFAIDRRTWARVCALGLNPAVAYLVLARFTGKDNVHTAASVQAIESRTGIARPRAKAALATLLARGFVRQVQDGTRPRYALVPYSPPPPPPPPARDPMTPLGRQAYEAIKRGGNPWVSRTVAKALVRQGWLKEVAGRFVVVPDPTPEPTLAKPDWVWLPNALVTGVKDETTAVERARQTGDVGTLQLLVDLYHAQDLHADGGISRHCVRKPHARAKVQDRGQYTVWAFDPRETTTKMGWCEATEPHRRSPTEEEKKLRPSAQDAIDFFDRFGRLESLGLVQWVEHLCDSEDPDAELMHPYRLAAPAESDDRLLQLEHHLARAAHTAALALLTTSDPTPPAGWCLAPVLRHQASVALVGIARLRYRPLTRKTSAWAAKLYRDGEGRLSGYYDIFSEKTPALANDYRVQHQRYSR